MTSSDRMNILRRQQLDRRLDQIRESLGALRAPEQGWIATIRGALGMTQAHLASAMNVTQSAVSQLEQRESERIVTLRALEEAAHALGGELVYAILPARPLSETLEDRASRIARRMTASVDHTMRLEDQETASDRGDPRVEELARELLDSPRRLWSIPDGD